MSILPEMLPMEDLPAGAVIQMPIELAMLGSLYIIKDGDKFRAVPNRPVMKYSCKCKTEYMYEEDFEHWPWMATNYVCSECGNVVACEEMNTVCVKGVMDES